MNDFVSSMRPPKRKSTNLVGVQVCNRNMQNELLSSHKAPYPKIPVPFLFCEGFWKPH